MIEYDTIYWKSSEFVWTRRLEILMIRFSFYVVKWCLDIRIELIFKISF